MSRLRDALRALAGDIQSRDATLAAMLGDQARSSRGAGPVPLPTQETAWRNSVWWAGIHLRANIRSSFSLDVLSPSTQGPPLARKKSQLFIEPWPDVSISDWEYGKEVDKCTYGNSIGIIRERNFAGNPTQVEPVEMNSSVRAVIQGRNELVAWRIGNEEYSAKDIWHEKAYIRNGIPLGMNPLANAAYSMRLYNSAQEFAATWFGLGMKPQGVLKNTAKSNIPADIREQAKEQFRNSTANGDIFVAGSEWEWTPAASADQAPDFLAQQADSSRDVCRYVGVPASMLDVEVSTGNITYANITQANLQFLITQMGPATHRDQQLWTRKAVPGPWFVRFNTDTLLKMDPQTRNAILSQKLKDRIITPTQARELDDQPAFTPADIAELQLFASMGKPAPTATKSAEGTLENA